MLSLQSRIRDPRLLPLADKVLRGERLSFEDGLLLYATTDLTGVGAMAHHVRLQKHGRAAYYVVSRRLSYTNVCYTHCQF
jgi:aminodeoxyfutalosine synthase